VVHGGAEVYGVYLRGTISGTVKNVIVTASIMESVFVTPMAVVFSSSRLPER
jgi:hypothetical protein